MSRANANRRPPRAVTPRASRVVFCFLGFIGLTVLFYLGENSRGRLAWFNYKRALIAQGQRFDPAAFNAPPVSDEQNFLKAPVVASWFSPDPASPAEDRAFRVIECVPPGDVTLLGSWTEARPTRLQEWRDLFLDMDRPLFGAGVHPELVATQSEEMIQLIVLDGVTLPDAIRMLAKQAGWKVLFDPRAVDMADETNALRQCPVSIRFENVTAREALEALLDSYGLSLVENPQTGTVRIRQGVKPPPLWLGRTVDLATVGLLPPADQVQERITIDGANARHAVERAARQAGMALQFAPELLPDLRPGPYSLTLSNVTPREALARVLADHGLTLEISDDGSVMRAIGSRGLPTAREVIGSFARFDPEFQALYDASQRPYCRTDINYRKAFAEGSTVMNLSSVRTSAQALALHASAHLALGNPETALRDLTVLARVVESFRDQPNLVGAMMGVAVSGLHLQMVWEGLASHRWREDQLERLEDQLRSVNLLAGWFLGLEGEQAQMNYWLETTPPSALAEQFAENITGYQRFGQPKPPWAEPTRWFLLACPPGWIRQNQVAYTQVIQAQLALCDVASQRVYPRDEPRFESIAQQTRDSTTPYTFLARRIVPFWNKSLLCTARKQTEVNLARLACALERYRLAHGQLPAELSELSPRFLQDLPHDLVNGRALKYRHTEDGQFLLYSVGWDRTDERGTVAGHSGQQGDWVWRYPARNLSLSQVTPGGG